MLDIKSDINKELAGAMRYGEIDRFVLKVCWWTFGGLVLLSFLNSVVKISDYNPSPFSWRVISLGEATFAVLLGLALTVFLFFLVGKLKNHYLWRILVSLVLTTYGYLIVFISGGSIEMHFLFFVMMALVAIYADWRLPWLMLIATGTTYAVFNYAKPEWVNFYGKNDFSILANVVPLLVAAIFTSTLTKHKRDSIENAVKAASDLEIAVSKRTGELEKIKKDLEEIVDMRTTELERSKKGLEEEVKKQTLELKMKLDEVQTLNQMMIGRELKMAELKKENETLKKKLGQPS